MKNFFLIAAIILFSTSALARGGQEGNGGAGVNRNGVLMTFGSAGLWVDPVPKKDEEIPDLLSLIDAINKIPDLTNQSKTEIFKYLFPTFDRTYYVVDKNHFDKEARAKLLKEYSKVIKTDEPLALFAVTDTIGKKTFLLPEFFDLKPAERMAILFHECLWLMFPDITYSEVIKAEVHMQTYLTNPADSKALLVIKDTVNRYDWPGTGIVSGIQFDKSMGINSGFAVPATKAYPPTFTIQSFDHAFGAQFVKCVAEKKAIDSDDFDMSHCLYLAKLQALDLKAKYWNSEGANRFSKMILTAKAIYLVISKERSSLQTTRCSDQKKGNATISLDCAGVDRFGDLGIREFKAILVF